MEETRTNVDKTVELESEIKIYNKQIKQLTAKKYLLECGIGAVVRENFDYFKENITEICSTLSDVNTDITFYNERLEEKRRALIENAASNFSGVMKKIIDDIADGIEEDKNNRKEEKGRDRK